MDHAAGLGKALCGDARAAALGLFAVPASCPGAAPHPAAPGIEKWSRHLRSVPAAGKDECTVLGRGRPNFENAAALASADSLRFTGPPESRRGDSQEVPCGVGIARHLRAPP